MRQFHGIVVILMALLAGCAGGLQSDFAAQEPEGTPVGSTSVATPSNGEATARAGSIAGLVTDEELQALPDAVVRLPDLGASLNVDVAGAFEFLDVPAGRHVVEAQAPGHVAVSKVVQVAASETIEAQFILDALAPVEPYIDVLPHSIFFNASATAFYSAAQQCQGCTWRVPTPLTPQFLVLEIDGSHAVANPVGGDRLSLYAWKNSLQERGGVLWGCSWTDDLLAECLNLPIGFTVNETQLMETVPTGEHPRGIQFRADCDPSWICFQERYEAWVSLFHHYDEVPEDYTAMPPS